MEWIDKIVLGLVDMYRTNNPYELCDLLEVLIIKLEENNPILAWHNSVYFRYLNGQEVIYLRNNLNVHYEEFYLKHELGHAILHTDIKNSLNINLININKIEKQANYFAFKLSDLNFDEIELDGMTLEQVSSCMEIPQSALKQLVNL